MLKPLPWQRVCVPSRRGVSQDSENGSAEGREQWEERGELPTLRRRCPVRGPSCPSD